MFSSVRIYRYMYKSNSHSNNISSSSSNNSNTTTFIYKREKKTTMYKNALISFFVEFRFALGAFVLLVHTSKSTCVYEKCLNIFAILRFIINNNKIKPAITTKSYFLLIWLIFKWEDGDAIISYHEISLLIYLNSALCAHTIPPICGSSQRERIRRTSE